MSRPTLRELVAEALRNAGENGHDFVGWSDQAIAVDMLTYAAELETADLDAVTAAVHALRGLAPAAHA